jgi:NhaP-type Na+/H+ or K+/H+ antiporter
MTLHVRWPKEFAHRSFPSGPYGANIFDPRSWGNSESTNIITLEFTRIVIAIGVFAIGVELPKKYMYRHWKSLFFLIVPVMTWVCSALHIFSSVKADPLL